MTKTCRTCDKPIPHDARSGPARSAERVFCSRACWRKRPISPAKDRFWSNVTAEPNTGCLLWMGGLDGNGYGPFMGDDGKRTRAHRFAYELAHGPIPDGAHILHSCDVPACVNAKHLRAGTHQENMADMVGRARHAFGARKSNTHLTDDDVRAIRASSDLVRVLASRYRVGLMTISEIRRGLRWRHVT